MNERFAYLLGEYGPPTDPVQFAAGEGASLRCRLPSGLLELWQDHGIGMWFGGKFQFCRPADYADVVDLLLADDPEFTPDKTFLIGFGAFGQLVLWHETLQKLEIDLPHLLATSNITRPGWQPKNPNTVIASSLVFGSRDDQFSLLDGNGSPMFKRCVKLYGRLEPGECYGLFPALALGGAPGLENIKRVKAREHFAFLAQVGPVRLMDYRGGAGRFVRNLGGG